MNKKNRKGLSLIELLIVISFVMFATAILLPLQNKERERSLLVVCSSRLHDIGTVIYIYQSDNNSDFPTNFGPNGESEARHRWTTKLGSYYGRTGFSGDKGTYKFDLLRCPTEKKIVQERETQYPEGSPTSIYGLNYYFVGAPTRATQWRARDIVTPSELPLIGDLSSKTYMNIPIGGSAGIVGYIMYPYYPHPKAFDYGYLDGDLLNNRTKFSYNGPAPNHNGRTNYLFADGHVDNLSYWPWEGVHDGTPFHPIGDPSVVKY